MPPHLLLPLRSEALVAEQHRQQGQHPRQQ
jgi:hypothetical protein